MNEQQFRDWRFDPDNPIAKDFSVFDISYYEGTDAVSEKIEDDAALMKI